MMHYSFTITSLHQISAGYLPRACICFNIDAESFPIWDAQFVNYIYTVDKGVYNAIADDIEDFFVKENREENVELVQPLDASSLQLIMKDSPNKGHVQYTYAHSKSNTQVQRNQEFSLFMRLFIYQKKLKNMSDPRFSGS